MWFTFFYHQSRFRDCSKINLNSQDILIIGNEFVERELTWERKFTRFNISLRYSNNLPLFYDTTMDSVTS